VSQRRLSTIGLTALAAIALTAASGASAGASSPCRPAQLRAAMTVIAGSAGAGNIEYRLLLKNASKATCTASGHPALRLRDAARRYLPTHVTGIPPGVTAILVTLRPGATASATLRFSPDVPGVGEQTSGPCERTAHSVRVSLASPGSGSLIGRVAPPTAVCEHGAMTETNLVHS